MTAIHTKSFRTPNSKYVLKNTFYKQLLNIFTVAKKRTLIHYPNVTFPTAFSQQKTHFFLTRKTNVACIASLIEWHLWLLELKREIVRIVTRGKRGELVYVGVRTTLCKHFEIFISVFEHSHTHMSVVPSTIPCHQFD